MELAISTLLGFRLRAGSRAPPRRLLTRRNLSRLELQLPPVEMDPVETNWDPLLLQRTAKVIRTCQSCSSPPSCGQVGSEAPEISAVIFKSRGEFNWSMT